VTTTLAIEQGGEETLYKKVTVTNAPSLPKVTAKVNESYNKFWDTPKVHIVLSCAKEMGEPLPEEHAVFDLSCYPGSEEGTQWNLMAMKKDDADISRLKSSKVNMTVPVAGYRKAVPVSATVKFESKAPVVTMSAVGKGLDFYPELGENEVQVCLNVGAAQELEIVDSWNSSSEPMLKLTAASAKLFEITAVEPTEEGLWVTLRTKTASSIKAGKTGTVQFAITSSEYALKNDAWNWITVKGAKATAKKISTAKTSLVNTVTGSKATAYSFQQLRADSEYLTIRPEVSDTELGFYTAFAAADKNTKAALLDGKLIIKKVQDANGQENFILKATPELYTVKKLSACKVTFTTYVFNLENPENVKALKAVTLTMNLKKQTKAAAVTGTSKVKGSLNVVDPGSSVTITPTFKNVPLGAVIADLRFANESDQSRYGLRDINGTTGVVTLVPENKTDSPLPIGKDTVELLYKYRLTDGTYLDVIVKATVSVVQTAAVKASAKTMTLYNAAQGENLGKTVDFTITKAGEAKIQNIEVTGLAGSGITYRFKDANDQWYDAGTLTGNEEIVQMKFFVDEELSRGIEKTYKAKMIVTLENAGTQKGKVVTYSLPMNITLKK